MGAFLLALSVVLVFVGSRISRGHALAATTAVGYGYGILRANYPDGISHFMFDAAVATLYLTEFFRQGPKIEQGLRRWVLVLIIWSLLMIPLGLIVGRQPLVIQLVGLRSIVFFLPMLLVGARITVSDIAIWSKSVVWLNLVAFGVAVAEYQLGVTEFFPLNDVTRIIYLSHDVAGDYHRIPSIFMSAHAYGGAMTMTLVLVASRATEERGVRRLIAWIALLATAAGPFLCGSRLPVVQLGLVLVLLLSLGRLDRRALIPMLVAGIVVGFYVGEDERLQRIATLAEGDVIEHRVQISVNERFLDIVVDYPLGAGLASAAGTSIPFFLSHLSETPIGIENEYSRLALELGVPGLLLWLVFLAWASWLRRPEPGKPLVYHGMWAVFLVVWASSFIGTGTLTAIPATMFLMLYMGASASHGRLGASEDVEVVSEPKRALGVARGPIAGRA